MKTISRDEWKARSPRPGMAENGEATEIVIHYSDSPGKGLTTYAKQKEAVREIQAFHMDGRGWDDIGYHFVVAQAQGKIAAAVFRGRSTHLEPAAQFGHNKGTIAVCVIMDGKEPLAEGTKKVLKELVKELHKHHPHTHEVLGHYQLTPTDCPGPKLKAFLPELRKVI